MNGIPNWNGIYSYQNSYHCGTGTGTGTGTGLALARYRHRDVTWREPSRTGAAQRRDGLATLATDYGYRFQIPSDLIEGLPTSNRKTRRDHSVVKVNTGGAQSIDS